MKAALAALSKLEVDAISLDADVPKAFIAARMGKQSEVKKNLADAQKLMVLMKARADQVRTQCEELLARVGKAINTDDGSLSAPQPEPASAEPSKANDLKKGAKAHAKPKAASSAPAPSAPAPKPKPAAPAKPASDDEAPAKPAAPSKPTPPPKDFEP